MLILSKIFYLKLSTKFSTSICNNINNNNNNNINNNNNDNTTTTTTTTTITTTTTATSTTNNNNNNNNEIYGFTCFLTQGQNRSFCPYTGNMSRGKCQFLNYYDYYYHYIFIYSR